MRIPKKLPVQEDSRLTLEDILRKKILLSGIMIGVGAGGLGGLFFGYVGAIIGAMGETRLNYAVIGALIGAIIVGIVSTMGCVPPDEPTKPTTNHWDGMKEDEGSQGR